MNYIKAVLFLIHNSFSNFKYDLYAHDSHSI